MSSLHTDDERDGPEDQAHQALRRAHARRVPSVLTLVMRDGTGQAGNAWHPPPRRPGRVGRPGRCWHTHTVVMCQCRRRSRRCSCQDQQIAAEVGMVSEPIQRRMTMMTIDGRARGGRVGGRPDLYASASVASQVVFCKSKRKTTVWWVLIILKPMR